MWQHYFFVILRNRGAIGSMSLVNVRSAQTLFPERNKALLEYLPQFNSNYFVESWVHMENVQKRLWVTNWILLMIVVILASDSQGPYLDMRDMLHHYIHCLLLMTLRTTPLYLQRGFFPHVTGCTSSIIGYYSISYLSQTQTMQRGPDAFRATILVTCSQYGPVSAFRVDHASHMCLPYVSL